MTIIDANTLFGFWPRRRADVSAETLGRTMQRHGIARALTIATTGVFAGFERGNDDTAQMCAQSNKMLLPIGTVDPRRYIGSLEEIDKRVAQGFRFWRLFWELQGWELDFHPISEILKRLADRQVTLMMDAHRRGDPSRLAARTKPYGLRTILLGVEGLHIGELVSILQDNPHILVETRRLADPQVITALAQRFGAERLVFGSASPLEYVLAAKLPLEATGLSDEQKALILGGNIARLLSTAGG